MLLLPLDLSLNIAAAVALFVLGFVIWSRRGHSTRAAIAVLMAVSLGFWLCLDWLARLQAQADAIHIIVWQGLYWFTVTLGPALMLHMAAHIARRRHTLLHASYGLSLLLMGLYAAFSIIQQRQLDLIDPALAFRIYTALTLGLYAAAVVISGAYLYPIIHASLPRLDRRQAQYALVLIPTFAMAGMLQFVAVPAGTGLLPLIGVFFLLTAVAGGSRSSLLDIHLTALDGMFAAIFGAFVVLLMRTETVPEALVAAASLVLLLLFAAAAMRLVHDESYRRAHLETLQEHFDAQATEHRDRLALMAHQVRGPVGGIGFVAESMLRGDYGVVPEPLHEPLQLIRQSVEGVTPLLTAHLENLAPQAEARSREAVAPETDIVAELDLIARQLEPRARDKGLKMELSCENVPSQASLDPTLLRHVAFNLLDNAIKYTDQGMILMRVSRYPKGLILSVTDSGIGLDAEDRARLFQPFTRLIPGPEGSGMGLYLIKRLLDQAGGVIEVKSGGRGRGATFMVEMPFENNE